ncbi:MAG: 50S ribosomal protein L13 [Caldilineales bacterium]|nr:50S ribosomal protein L13 [Caldilineales bacterium]
MNKTFSQRPEDVQREWLLVDAEGKTLGRLASEIAKILRGKHKPTFTPHVDGGDFVVVINADKIRVTGDRLESKKYYRHSGYMGGLKEISLRRMLETHPERVLELTNAGGLPVMVETPRGG